MGEQIELIDEDDSVIGQAEVEKVHQKQMLHHSVHIILMTSEGRFFCARKNPKKKRYGGWWTIPGMHLLPGDTYETTAKRLLKTAFKSDCGLEETGKIRVNDGYENEISMMYMCHSDKKFNIDPDQFEEGKFLKPTEAEALAKTQKVTPYFLHAIRLAKKKLGI